MPRERRARVVGLSQDQIEVRLESSCAGCIGCRGGCDFTRALAGRELIALPRTACPPDPQMGQSLQLRLRYSEAALAWSAYGVPTLTLIASALLGAMLAWLIDGAINLWVAAGVLLGTFLSLAQSKAPSASPFEVCPAPDDPGRADC